MKKTKKKSTKVKKQNKKLQWYSVTGYARVEFRTLVKAKSKEEALKIASDREPNICIHGTDDNYAADDWVYVDAPDMVEPNLAEEYEDGNILETD